MNIQSLPWLKFAHDSYIFGFRLTASPLVKAAFLDLLCLAMKQTPALSIPNDDTALSSWLGLTVKRWQKIKNAVLSQFRLNSQDNRYYSPMLVELYSDTEQPKDTTTQPPRQRTSSAERVARHRAKQKALANVTTTVTHDVTPPCNADVTPQTVTSNATVMPVTVTLGGKGGDLDLKLENLEKEVVVSKDFLNNQSRLDVTPKSVTPHTTTKFCMPFDFKVEPNELEPFMAKLEVPMTKHTSNTLNHFVAHYLAKDFKNTRDEWIYQYALWLKREKDKPVDKPLDNPSPQPTKLAAEFIQPVKPLWETLAEQKQQQQANAKSAEQLAKGDDALAQLRKTLGLKAA